MPTRDGVTRAGSVDKIDSADMDMSQFTPRLFLSTTEFLRNATSAEGVLKPLVTKVLDAAIAKLPFAFNDAAEMSKSGAYLKDITDANNVKEQKFDHAAAIASYSRDRVTVMNASASTDVTKVLAALDAHAEAYLYGDIFAKEYAALHKGANVAATVGDFVKALDTSTKPLLDDTIK